MNKNVPKPPQIFNCEKCNLTTSNKKDFKKHCMTTKHLNNHNLEYLEQKIPEYPFICKNCNKGYNVRNSLWYHEKKCNEQKNIGVSMTIEENTESEEEKEENLVKILIKENMDFKNIILDLIKNNGDLQKQMIDVCKTSNTTINNTNSHNKTFNMQVFLNEKCKDAMNIMDFVNSMTLQLSDLEDVGDVGYVEGISRIITRKLNEIDVYKRPIHCSDYKREVMYVRDDDIWEKENCTFDKIRKAIKYITKKNSDLLIPWREENPQCMNTSHRLNDVYIRLIGQAMGGRGEFVDNENKIIKKISKAVIIDKSDY